MPATPGAISIPDASFRKLVDGVRDYAIFLIDPEGYIQTWNEGARRIKGYEPEEIIGQHISRFYPAEAIERGWPAQELAAAANAGRFEDEGWRLRKEGTAFWASVVITAIRDDGGRLTGFSKITRDLTERRENEERLRRSEERFRLLLEGVADYSIYMLDPEGARLNRRAESRGWRVRKDGTRFWADVVVTALHDRSGELRGFAKVTRDLSERKRMENLEDEGRHLTEFLAMLAHELRNPLAPIRSAASILGAQPNLSPQAAWCRDVIERQALHLTRLVDDLLDVSRITRGKLLMQTTTIDVNEAVHRAVEAVRPLVEQRGHRLELDLARAPILMNGDLTRITQVVINLLNNAAKYTRPGGELRIETQVDRDNALIRVKDNGEGISPETLEGVFDLFSQGERTLDRSEGGLGIGLTLARRIAILHGGAISARSDGVGKGAEFTVSLPVLR